MHGIYKHNWYQRNTITWTNGNPVDLTRQYTNALYTKQDAEKLLDIYAYYVENTAIPTATRQIAKAR